MLVNLTDLQSGRSLDFVPIGQPIPIMSYMYQTNVSEILTPSKFIELTKDLTGSGQFNEGKLISQVVTTVGASNSERYYTAIIDDINSPLYGETVILMNSSEVQLSNSSWVNIPTVLSSYNGADSYRFGRMQGHWHTIVEAGFPAINPRSIVVDIGEARVAYSLDSRDNARTPLYSSDGTNGTPRTGSNTEQSSVVCKMFMRIK